MRLVATRCAGAKWCVAVATGGWNGRGVRVRTHIATRTPICTRTSTHAHAHTQYKHTRTHAGRHADCLLGQARVIANQTQARAVQQLVPKADRHKLTCPLCSIAPRTGTAQHASVPAADYRSTRDYPTQPRPRRVHTRSAALLVHQPHATLDPLRMPNRLQQTVQPCNEHATHRATLGTQTCNAQHATRDSTGSPQHATR